MVKKLNAPNQEAGTRGTPSALSAVPSMLDPTLDFGEDFPRAVAAKAKKLLEAKGIVAPPAMAAPAEVTAAAGAAATTAAAAAEPDGLIDASAPGFGLEGPLPPAGFSWGVTA